jgi:hypothetical protein
MFPELHMKESLCPHRKKIEPQSPTESNRNLPRVASTNGMKTGVLTSTVAKTDTGTMAGMDTGTMPRWWPTFAAGFGCRSR